MTNTDLKTLLLEILSDTRLQTIIRHYLTMTSKDKRLLVRLTKTLSR